MSSTALLVDPDSRSRMAMSELLTVAGYKTITADGFAAAVQLLESIRPDLLITVARLGRFSGLHLVRRGHLARPRMSAIVIEDSQDPWLESEARRCGATACLVKPVDSWELLERIPVALPQRTPFRRLFKEISPSQMLGGSFGCPVCGQEDCERHRGVLLIAQLANVALFTGLIGLVWIAVRAIHALHGAW